jgi:Gluconate 2-dehydrogenase subunit 3
MPFLSPSQRAITPGHQGRFAGFDVLGQVDRWDALTAGVVLARLDPPAGYSFFTPDEQAAAGALFDLLLAQHDEPKVPVLTLVDRRLAADETDGWRYEDMPEDRDAWRFTLAALDADAREKFGRVFQRLRLEEQAALVEGVHGAEEWHGLAAPHVWSLWTRYACAAFYSHPWAWNEIGFGGPAYPRGYQALGVDKLEHWEVRSERNQDPVPWGERVEAARRAHDRVLGADSGHR